jgi:hypothetical protein
VTNAPAGWYPDGSGQQRYWDGAQWTEHFAPVPTPASFASAPSTPAPVAARRSRTRLFIGIGAGVLVLAALGVVLGVVLTPPSVIGYLKGTWTCAIDSSDSSSVPQTWGFDGANLTVLADSTSLPEVYPVTISGNQVMVNGYVLQLPASAADGPQTMSFLYEDQDPSVVEVTKSGNRMIFGSGTQQLLTCAKAG